MRKNRFYEKGYFTKGEGILMSGNITQSIMTFQIQVTGYCIGKRRNFNLIIEAIALEKKKF
jgi:hypothetical protein